MSHRRALLAAVLLTLSPGLVGCTGDASDSGDSVEGVDGGDGAGDGGEQPEDAAAALAEAMTAGELVEVAVTNQSDPPQKLWRRVTSGMGAASADVSVTSVESDPQEGPATTTATLRTSWTLPDTADPWIQEGVATLMRSTSGEWLVGFDEAVLGLRSGEVLDLDPVEAERAAITGAGGTTIVEDRPVLRFGIDKTRVGPGRQEASARALARVLDVDSGALADRVVAAGDQAFVEAIVLRRSEAGRSLSGVDGLKGVGVVEDTVPLAPTRDFARPVLGSVGPVTAEMIEESDGSFEVGDEAGISGLQQRYDERLRGTPGWVVSAVRDGAGRRSRELHRVEPEAGEPLETTLDLDLQALAERVLAGVGPASALVAIEPSTGDLVAVASGLGGGGLSTATVGQYAPGSTFKVVSTLALLRNGLSPTSRVSCPATTVVDGKRFENYDDYPSSGLGSITLREAVANSCNTAFITAFVTGRDRAEDLAGAAAALGLGRDFDLGFPAYFGQVPEAASETSAAAALIGQGEVLASPMTMAAVAASVAGGRTVVPHLLPEFAPDADAERPLSGPEARVLRELLRAVVTDGSGAALGDLPGPPVLAKTGTAEFGDEEPLETHAWMIAVQGDLAVAVFVELGDSGSRTAGPLLEQFLRGAR